MVRGQNPDNKELAAVCYVLMFTAIAMTMICFWNFEYKVRCHNHAVEKRGSHNLRRQTKDGKQEAKQLR